MNDRTLWKGLSNVVGILSILCLCISAFCYFFNVDFDPRDLADEIQSSNWQVIDYQEMTRAINSLQIADPSSWGSLEDLAIFFNGILGVFRGIGYLALSFVYCFGFLLEFVAVVLG